MSVTLPWRPVQLTGPGPAIETSLTEAETWMLRELAQDKRVLEIGAAYGYSTVAMAQVATHVLSIDPHQDMDSYEAFKANLEAYHVRNVVPVLQESEAVLQHLPQAWFGLVFVDGAHWQASVEHDIRYSMPLLQKGGWMALHDYGESTCPGVKEAIDRLLPDGYLVWDTLWLWQA